MDAKITYNTSSHPFSIWNRCGRLLWAFVWGVLFRMSPRPFHAWRRMVLRCFGARVGPGAHIYPGAVIWAPWNVEFGSGCGIADGVILYSQVGRAQV